MKPQEDIVEEFQDMECPLPDKLNGPIERNVQMKNTSTRAAAIMMNGLGGSVFRVVLRFLILSIFFALIWYSFVFSFFIASTSMVDRILDRLAMIWWNTKKLRRQYAKIGHKTKAFVVSRQEVPSVLPNDIRLFQPASHSVTLQFQAPVPRGYERKDGFVFDRSNDVDMVVVKKFPLTYPFACYPLNVMDVTYLPHDPKGTCRPTYQLSEAFVRESWRSAQERALWLAMTMSVYCYYLSMHNMILSETRLRDHDILALQISFFVWIVWGLVKIFVYYRWCKSGTTGKPDAWIQDWLPHGEPMKVKTCSALSVQ